MQKKEGKIEKKEEKVVAMDTFEMIDQLGKKCAAGTRGIYENGSGAGG